MKYNIPKNYQKVILKFETEFITFGTISNSLLIIYLLQSNQNIYNKTYILSTK